MTVAVTQPKTWDHPGGKLIDLGSEALSQDELLAILLGSGIPGQSALDVAKAVLDEFGGLYQILRLGTLENLSKIRGVGPRKARRILAALNLGRRLAEHEKATSRVEPFRVQEPLFPYGSENGNTPAKETGEAELLAEIIGSGIKGRTPLEIARDLIAKFGSFAGLYGQDMGLMQDIPGLDSVKVVRIAAALEIAKRMAHALS